MSFRMWHYLGRIAVRVLLPACVLAIVAPRGSILQGIGVGAFL